MRNFMRAKGVCGSCPRFYLRWAVWLHSRMADITLAKGREFRTVSEKLN